LEPGRHLARGRTGVVGSQVEDDDRDLASGAVEHGGDRGSLFDDAAQKFAAFVGRGDAGSSEERFGADLRFRVRVREEVVVPVWMLGAPRFEASTATVASSTRQ
jgi:hypothetical protein